MKKITLLFLLVGLLGINSIANAQTVEKGTIILGGDAFFTSTSFDGIDDNLTYLSLTPSLGYFVIDDLAIGARVGFGFTSLGDFDATEFSLGLSARYYVFDGLFPQVGFQFNSLKFNDADADTSTDIMFGIGYTSFINKSVALEPMIMYSINSEDSSTFGIGIGLQIFLGR
jgi:hypothetical protein